MQSPFLTEPTGAPSEHVGQKQLQRLEYALEQSAAADPVIECTNKRVEAVDVVGDVDICEVAVDRRGRVSDLRRCQTQIFRVRGEQVVQRIQLTSGCDVLLEVGDPVAVERVDRRRVQIIGRHASVRLNSAREGGVAYEHEVQIGAGDAVFCELCHGDRLGGGAL